MRKTLLLLIALSISLAFGCFTNAQLEINDVLNNGTPKADDAYQRILNEYEDFRGYEDTSNLTCSAIDEITISSNAVNDAFLDQANKYILIYSPYQIEEIRNGDSSIDKSKIKIKIKEITPNEEEISFTITSEDIETDKDYYGIIVPADIFETIGRPSNELYFNLSKNVCEIQYKNTITLKPGLNTFSTPAIVKSISFSNGGNNISFASMEKGQRKAMTINNSNIKNTVKPLEGYIIRNNNSSDVTMTIEYDTDNSNSLTLSKNLDAGRNFLGVTTRNNPFNNIANTTATMILDLTNGGDTNYVQIGKTFLEASTFILGKAYAVFVNNSNGIYGGVNNYGGDSQCIGMDQANVNHEYNNGVITLRRTAIDGNSVQISLFDPINEVYELIGEVDMDDEEFNYQIERDGEHIFMLDNGCKTLIYRVNAIDCNDPIIQLACASDSDECPEVCKPEITSLTNNLTETVIFYPNDTSRKIVFNGSYTATEDFDVMGISVEEINKKEFIRGDTIDFNIIIDGEEVTNYPISCDIECDIESCACGYGGGTSTNDSVYTINKGDVVNIQVTAEFNGVYSSNDTYIYNVILRDFSGNVNRFISMDLAPIKIVKNNDIKVEIATGQNTVLLSAQNQKIAEFTVLPRDTNTASFDNLIISFSGADIDSDDIRVKIDGKEYDAEDSNHLTGISYLYEPNETIPSSGAKVQIYLKNKYIGALDTTIVSINGKEQNRTFSKRFEDAIAYIINQQNFGDFTRFTAGVDINETNTTVSNLVLWSNGEEVAEISGEFSDGTEFDGEGDSEIKYIDEIRYNIGANTIKIKKSQYDDYFRVGSEYAKVFNVGK